jgi:hypothetical protein
MQAFANFPRLEDMRQNWFQFGLEPNPDPYQTKRPEPKPGPFIKCIESGTRSSAAAIGGATTVFATVAAVAIAVVTASFAAGAVLAAVTSAIVARTGVFATIAIATSAVLVTNRSGMGMLLH